MKKIRLVTNNSEKSCREESFSDLKLDLENRLMSVRSDSDVLDLKSEVNHLLQTLNLSSEEKRELLNFRQKTYDKRKKLQAYVQIENKNADDFEKAHNGPNSDLCSAKQYQHTLANTSALKQIVSYFAGIDVEGVIHKLPALILFASCAIVTMCFIWKQSVPLYQSIGFSEPEICAFGALLMIAGFSVIHTISRSKIVLLLCLYASAYEVVLIVDGTMKNETQISQTQIEQNADVVWLKEQKEHSLKNYKELMTRYENPSSSVFKNSWYKSKYVDPAWQKYSSDQKNLSEKVEKLSTKNSSWDRIGMLKILYRLGLVFLCMISLHHLLKLGRSVEKKEERFLRPKAISAN